MLYQKSKTVCADNEKLSLNEFLEYLYKDSLIVNGITQIPVKNIIDLFYKKEYIQSPFAGHIEKLYELLMIQQSIERVNLVKKRAYIELPPNSCMV